MWIYVTSEYLLSPGAAATPCEELIHAVQLEPRNTAKTISIMAIC